MDWVSREVAGPSESIQGGVVRTRDVFVCVGFVGFSVLVIPDLEGTSRVLIPSTTWIQEMMGGFGSRSPGQAYSRDSVRA